MTSGGPPTSLVCPVIVGRRRDLAVLERYLAGETAPVLALSGEAGIGKSRLAAEAVRLALEHGWRVIRAACAESDAALPDGALIDLLRGSLAADPAPPHLPNRRAPRDR